MIYVHREGEKCATCGTRVCNCGATERGEKACVVPETVYHNGRPVNPRENRRAKATPAPQPTDVGIASQTCDWCPRPAVAVVGFERIDHGPLPPVEGLTVMQLGYPEVFQWHACADHVFHLTPGVEALLRAAIAHSWPCGDEEES